MVEQAKYGEPSNSLDLLAQAIAEYRRGPITPELMTKYWREKLKIGGERVGLNILVPDCDWTEEEIRRPMLDIMGNTVQGMMVYNPEELRRGRMGLIRLGEMYPGMASYTVGRNTLITNTHETRGWIKVEATIGAPNLNTSREELVNFARRQGYLGQRESTYILASQASKDLTGRYFDEGGTWSRLLGVRGESIIFRNRRYVMGVGAHFDSDGRLHVDWGLGSLVNVPDLGARFEEVKRA